MAPYEQARSVIDLQSRQRLQAVTSLLRFASDLPFHSTSYLRSDILVFPRTYCNSYLYVVVLRKDSHNFRGPIPPATVAVWINAVDGKTGSAL